MQTCIHMHHTQAQTRTRYSALSLTNVDYDDVFFSFYCIRNFRHELSVFCIYSGWLMACYCVHRSYRVVKSRIIFVVAIEHWNEYSLCRCSLDVPAMRIFFRFRLFLTYVLALFLLLFKLCAHRVRKDSFLIHKYCIKFLLSFSFAILFFFFFCLLAILFHMFRVLCAMCISTTANVLACVVCSTIYYSSIAHWYRFSVVISFHVAPCIYTLPLCNSIFYTFRVQRTAYSVHVYFVECKRLSWLILLVSSWRCINIGSDNNSIENY